MFLSLPLILNYELIPKAAVQWWFFKVVYSPVHLETPVPYKAQFIFSLCWSHHPRSPATRCLPGLHWCPARRVPGTPARLPVRRLPCSQLLSVCEPWSAHMETRCRCWRWERGGGEEEEPGWRLETPSGGGRGEDSGERRVRTVDSEDSSRKHL